MNDYSEGDIVAIFGGERTGENHIADAITIATIIIVGSSDLVVVNDDRYSTSYHTVPKDLCIKLKLEEACLLSSKRILMPKINDLVASFEKIYKQSSLEKTVGIVQKIIYNMGKEDKYVLMCGTKLVTVSADNIVVLDRT